MKDLKRSGRFILTEEGRKYLRDGFPEENLVRILRKPMKINDARKKVSNFHIALSWAKKNGWVKIDKGKLVPASKSAVVPEKAVMKKVGEGKSVSDRDISLLVVRKLARKSDDAASRAGKLAGGTVTTLTPDLIKTGMWKKVKLRPYNVAVGGDKVYPGKRQPYKRFLSVVRQKLVELGFREMNGPVIETEFWNFDALFQAQNHPSRDWTQTYTLKSPKRGDLPDGNIVKNVKAAHENGWKTGSTGWGYTWDPLKAAQLMPRAHGTALSARTLASSPVIPGKYFGIVRCFRPDVIDATHGVEFNQCEGIIVDESLDFKGVLGILEMFAIEVAGAEKVKFHPDYYPFTEPSVQLSARHPEMGWIEFAGAGIFRPELTEPLGVKQPVLAWGMGIDRLAMFKLGISDIRELFSQNIDWLRKQKVTI
jgi:phenylalanyl-tRNA synthetase alpha chain